MTDLNKRQWEYLKLIYEIDQENERFERSTSWKRGYRSSPASEWRPIVFDEPVCRLRNGLEELNLLDEGTGSTFLALETRGLIKRIYKSHKLIPEFIMLFIEITPAGRKLVRQATGEQRPKKRPTGTMPDYKWQALVDAYRAGPDGLVSDGFGHYSGFSWITVWKELPRYKYNGQEFPLISDFRANDGSFRLRLSRAGLKFYSEKWEYYRQFYPDIEADQPAPDIADIELIKPNPLGDSLRAKRGNSNYRELAQQLGVSPSDLWRVEQGKTLRDEEAYTKICQWLGISPEPSV